MQAFGDVSPPAAELGDVLRMDRAIGLADEAFDPLAVGEFDRTDGERWRDAIDKTAYLGSGQLPDLNLDCLARLGSDHARSRRRPAGQSIKAVARRSVGPADELAPAIRELPVERKAGHVGAAYRHLYGRAGGGSRPFRRHSRVERAEREVQAPKNLVPELKQPGVSG